MRLNRPADTLCTLEAELVEDNCFTFQFTNYTNRFLDVV